jgi:hypothetical protein
MSEIINLDQLTPITIHDFRLFAPTVINGNRIMAVLDTGASMTTIVPDIAKISKNNLKSKYCGAFGEKEAIISEDNEITFLGITNHRNAWARELENDAPFIYKAILDASIIFSKPIVIDFNMLRIWLQNEMSIEFPNYLRAKFLKDSCLIKTNESISILLDTGAGISVVNKNHLKHNNFTLTEKYTTEVSDSTGNKQLQIISTCSGFRLNDLTMPSFDCFIIDLASIEEIAGHQIDMVLGANIMIKSGIRLYLNKDKNEASISF